MSEDKFQGWIASLSNGETVFESPSTSGEISAWQKLRARCEKEGISVTQIRLQLGGLTFIGANNADGYCQCWEQHLNLFDKTKPPLLFRGIGSVIEEHVFITWVDSSGNIKQEIRTLESMAVHCVLKK